MEEIDLIEIEKIAKQKGYSDLNKKELSLINMHFENKEEYESFRLVISQGFKEEMFPNEIDDAVFEKLYEDDKKAIVPFSLLKKIAAVILLLLSFGAGWFLNNNETQQFVEIVKTNSDTIYIKKETVLLDTIVVDKFIIKETIVEVFIEKEIEKIELAEKIEVESINYDSIPFSENEIFVENNSLDKMEDLNGFFTEF